MSADDERLRRCSSPSRAASSLGGLRAAASLTPEQRHERAKKAAATREAKRDAEREAAGLPPRLKRAPEPSARELEPWLAEVDRRWPDRQWPHSDARRREAILLARCSIAEQIAQQMKATNEGGE